MNNKFDSFREFVKEKPFLKDKVRNKETTWQELFERYDLYGEDDEIFIEKVEDKEVEDSTDDKEENEEGISSILGLLAGLDMDKISESLNSMKKVLNILSEVTKKDDEPITSSRRKSRPYVKEDD